MRVTDAADSDYHLSQPFAARIVGGAFVVAAGFVFATTVVGVLAGWSLAVVVLVALAGLVGTVVAAVWLRNVVVVHFDAAGYRVRVVRGVGVAAAAWTDVTEAVPAEALGEPCIVLRLRSDRTSTIPLRAVAADPDAFVADLRARLQHGHGLRPWEPRES